MREEYGTKIVLHIPHFAFVDGGLVEIEHEDFCKAMSIFLNACGVTDWYETIAYGRYKGRRYEQELWTLFTKEEKKEDVLTAFRATMKMFDWLHQESIGYECNGTLYVESAT